MYSQTVDVFGTNQCLGEFPERRSFLAGLAEILHVLVRSSEKQIRTIRMRGFIRRSHRAVTPPRLSLLSLARAPNRKKVH